MSRGARVAECSCGKLRVTCVGEPELVSLCHCRAYQRRTGSTYGIAAFFRRDRVTAAGPSKEYSRSSDSGLPLLFHFCSQCGSTVYWEPRRKPDFIAVGVGSFADPSFPAPTQSVYLDRRHPWVGDVRSV